MVATAEPVIRKTSVTLIIRSDSISQALAIELQNKLQDVVDNYENVTLSASYTDERVRRSL